MFCNFPKFHTAFRASISNQDIDDLKTAEQHFSDCYLVATLESLSNTENGRKILKNQIEYDSENPEFINCYLYTKNGKKEKFTVPSSKAISGYEKLYQHQQNKIIRSLDISVGEYENKYKSKPLICKIGDKFKQFSFEYNLPSHFMKTLTGIKPTVNIAETDFNLSLKPYEKQVRELFEKMDKNKEHSFVIGTGIKKVDGRRWHTYVLEDVDLASNKVRIKNKRGNIVKEMTVEEVLSKFKYIVGYFNDDLLQQG